MSEGDIVAIVHSHAKYRIPYFLGLVRETPASVNQDERLRVAWLEAPEKSAGGYTYTLDHWVDECACALLARPPLPTHPVLHALPWRDILTLWPTAQDSAPKHDLHGVQAGGGG
jgi:hypothetical protein